MRGSRLISLGATGAAFSVGLTGSADAGPIGSPHGAEAIAATPSATATAVTTMTQAERIGQLFIVGGAVTGPGSATTAAISTYHVGT